MLAVSLSTLLAANAFVIAGLTSPLTHPLTRTQLVTMFDQDFDDSFARMAQRLESMFEDDFFSTPPALAGAFENDDVRHRGGALRAPGRAIVDALDQLMMPSLKGRDGKSAFTIDESDAQYTITMSAPGVEEGDVKVSVDGDTLTVAGETSREDGGSSYHSSFRRSMRLPTNIDAQSLSSKCEGGRVTIELPKKMIAPAPPVQDADPRARAPHASADEILTSLQAEAEALAAESPRFARWLEANGLRRNGKEPKEEGRRAAPTHAD